MTQSCKNPTQTYDLAGEFEKVCEEKGSWGLTRWECFFLEKHHISFRTNCLESTHKWDFLFLFSNLFASHSVLIYYGKENIKSEGLSLPLSLSNALNAL